jgi:hypothetical protein
MFQKRFLGRIREIGFKGQRRLRPLREGECCSRSNMHWPVIAVGIGSRLSPLSFCAESHRKAWMDVSAKAGCRDGSLCAGLEIRCETSCWCR